MGWWSGDGQIDTWEKAKGRARGCLGSGPWREEEESI